MKFSEELEAMFFYGLASIFIFSSINSAWGQTPLPTLTPTGAKNLPPGVQVTISLTPVTEDEIPADPVEYGKWLEKQSGHNTGTPGSDFKPSPEPAPPTNFTIEPGNGLAHLTWDAMPRAISYILYISEDGKNFKRRLKKPFKKSEITIGVLQNGKTYYFGVVCVGPYGRETKMVIQQVIPKKKLKKS